jgi:hypothetical protein
LTHISFYTQRLLRFHHDAFANQYEGQKLQNALYAHSRMGYNFIISKVAVAIEKQSLLANIESSLNITINNSIDSVYVDVMIQQKGVAPFYYPLNLQLHCQELGNNTATITRSLNDVHKAIEHDQKKRFTFQNISLDCLRNLTFTLDSPYKYPDRPIKFAQKGIYNNETSASLTLLNVPIPTNQEIMEAIQFYDISSTAPTIVVPIAPTNNSTTPSPTTSTYGSITIPPIPTSYTVSIAPTTVSNVSSSQSPKTYSPNIITGNDTPTSNIFPSTNAPTVFRLGQPTLHSTDSTYIEQQQREESSIPSMLLILIVSIVVVICCIISLLFFGLWYYRKNRQRTHQQLLKEKHQIYSKQQQQQRLSLKQNVNQQQQHHSFARNSITSCSGSCNSNSSHNDDHNENVIEAVNNI